MTNLDILCGKFENVTYINHWDGHRAAYNNRSPHQPIILFSNLNAKICQCHIVIEFSY